MKKFVTVLMFCLLLVCATACSNNMKFDSEEAMLAHMEGMWVIDTVLDEKEYYIFQGGKIYTSSDHQYSSQVEQSLEEIANSGNTEAFPYQTFDVVSQRLYVEDLMYLQENVTFKPDKGTIILDAGKGYETRIVIGENAIERFENGNEFGLTLIKLADAPDFKTDHFRELFQAVRDEWTVPIEHFICTTEEYLTPLAYMHSVIQNFTLVSESNGTSVYTLGGIVDDPYGALILSEENIMFFFGEDYKGDLLRSVEYRPKGNYNIMITDRTTADLGELLLYTVPVLENVPGAYSKVADMLALYEQQSTVSGGVRSLDVTIEGITYRINRTTDNMETVITIYLPDELPIPAKDSNPSGTESTTPSETEPQATGLFGKLDYNTVWTADYTITPWEYTLYFAFEENGTCYFALGDSTAVMSAGSGTYTAGEDNSLELKLTIDGIPGQYAYQFTPETNTLTVTSREGIVGDRGQEHILKKHPDPSYLERLKGWAKASTSADSGEDWS